MVRDRGRRSLYVVSFVALFTCSSQARAQTSPVGAQPASEGKDAKKVCIGQHESAQTFRRTGKLLEARDAAVVCAREECPAVVRTDCADWMESVGRTIPTLVIRAKVDDRDLLDVNVLVDGKLVKSHLDGTPFELNPGAHKLRFEHANLDPIEQEILVLEGEKNRVLSVNFAKVGPALAQPIPTPAAREEPTTVETYRPIPVLTYVLGGVALAGAGGFAAFALSGQSEKKSLESSCRPICTDEELEPVRTRFMLADASLGIAVVSAVASGVLYFTRPTKPVPMALQGKAARSASPFAFGIAPTRAGAQFSMGAEF
jgi:hypothetical protein